MVCAAGPVLDFHAHLAENLGDGRGSRLVKTGGMQATVAQEGAGPWSPGILSEMPPEVRPLATILRPESTSTTVAEALELRRLTGLPLSELVAFRPSRLVLHELLVRVTADLSVPDGTRIEDLGINFREITRFLLARYLDPRMESLTVAFDRIRLQLSESIRAALAQLSGRSTRPAQASPSGFAKLFGNRFRQSKQVAQTPRAAAWGLAEIAECERRAGQEPDPIHSASYRCLARVMSALFTVHGQSWGTHELIVSLATDLACNTHGSEALGDMIDPVLKHAAGQEGFLLLPPQERPVVINTKGPSASGKSSLRPLQRVLAGAIGADWSDFALISPDIWRKQLLDYGSLGKHYKYAGALTSEELQIVDQKLDRYMARKQQRGAMSHLLIDRFRFDSFAADSHEAGSNLLTRFGHTVYLFFMVTPPEQLVERAWKRGLAVGRYKAVDDTLAHSVEAYSGMPGVFFTWIHRSDKRIHFEFLDNSVRLGELPRTVAFGSNEICYVLDVQRMIDVERFARVNVEALSPESLYPDLRLLEPEHNLGFLRKCVEGFPELVFADQASGRVYLRIVSRKPVLVDRDALSMASADPGVRACLATIAPAAFEGSVATCDTAQYLRGPQAPVAFPTIGRWGDTLE
jgi:hypothetical protein